MLQDRLIGFQLLAPHAADLAAGFALAMKLQTTRSDLIDCIGIQHPSAADVCIFYPNYHQFES